jgi:hypothetical protein
LEKGITANKTKMKSFIMKPLSITNREVHSLEVFKRAFFKVSLSNELKRKIFRKNPLKLNMKVNSILAIALILVMLASVFAWLTAGTGTPSNPDIVDPVSNDPTVTFTPSPTSQQTATPTRKPAPAQENPGWNPISIIMPPEPTRPPGIIETADSTMWKSVADYAWKYYQPGIGVDANTGLPKASLGFPHFTDWDLGVYIQAVIDANKTGLVGYTGDWGSNARLDKVLTFLETRELNNASYPFWFYQASDGKNYRAASDRSTSNVDAVDTGRLFVALNNLKIFNSNLTSRVDNFVYNRFNNRSDYVAMLPDIKSDSMVSTSIYAYYYVSGFASFWPTELSGAPNMILNKILTANTTTTYGVSLPKAEISCEPLLSAVFELNNNPQLMNLTKQVYTAHEARYNATGEYVAFSEGNTQTGFIYEWVVLPNGDTWKIINPGESTYSNMSPIIFTKVALGFLALYKTTFARDMNIFLEKAFQDSSNGYYAGAIYSIDHNNAQLVLSIDSNTNGMILGAARYSIQKNP